MLTDIKQEICEEIYMHANKQAIHKEYVHAHARKKHTIKKQSQTQKQNQVIQIISSSLCIKTCRNYQLNNNNNNVRLL